MRNIMLIIARHERKGFKMNDYILRAEKFLGNCVFDGLAHSWDVDRQKYVKPYPEVTGYVVKYYLEYINKVPNNIKNAADYLLSIQNETGGYCSFSDRNILYAFDTAQIIRGFCAMYRNTGEKKYAVGAEKGGSFLLNSQETNGAFKPIYNCSLKAWVIRDETYNIWNGPYSGLMCKLTESLEDLYMLTKNSQYLEALKRAADFYENVEYIECSHPLGYWLEGLLAAGKTEKVLSILYEKVLNRIESNGYISYTNKLDYAYVSGTMQLGIILYKMGFRQEAKQICNYGRMVQDQDSSGGLFQYANKDGSQNKDIHSEINSWGTKYFCELERLIEKERKQNGSK